MWYISVTDKTTVERAKEEKKEVSSFTRKAIIEAFVKLLNERPLNKITIKDIAE